MKYISLDLETRELKPHNGVIWSLAISRIVGRKVKTELIADCNGLSKLRPDIKKELEDPNICKIIHSGVFDIPFLRLVLGCYVRNVWCTETNEVVIQGMRVPIKAKNIQPGSAADRLLRAHSSALKYVLPRYGFKEPDKEIRQNFINRPFGKKFIKAETDYMIGDVKDLIAIQKAQEYILRRDELLEVALLENKTTEKISQMRSVGIGFDGSIWKSIAEENMRLFKKRMAKLPKEVSNWNSPKQVKDYFFSKGILLNSFDDLDDVYLQTRNRTLGDFIFARELHKAVTSYGMNWFEEGFIDSDGRIRCDVTQCINTGRMSMSNPNLQQLPGEGNADMIHKQVMKMLYQINGEQKAKPRHREAFVPAKGKCFVIGDFSGQEIGIMAAASGEKLWINAMLRGEDVHSLTASLVNPNEWKEGTAKGCTFPKKCECPEHMELRKPAKINNFMLAYGGGPQKLAATTGMDQMAARMYVGAHKRVIPNLTRYLEKCGRMAMDTGVAYSADPYRRRRVLRGEESWQIRNQGMNTPIQSAGANMLKLAMISTPDWAPIVLVIHDEIILEVPIKDAVKAGVMLKSVMEQSANYITGIKGLIKVEPRIAFNIMKEGFDKKLQEKLNKELKR